MSSARTYDLTTLIERLTGDIRLAQEHSLHLTTQLLKMALLDLKMMTHSISDDELRAFSESLEEGSGASDRFEVPERKN